MNLGNLLMCMCNTFRCLEFLLLSYNDGSSLVPDIFKFLRNLMMYIVREIHENNLQELSIFPSLKLSLLEEFIVEMGNALANPSFLVRPLRNAVIPGAVICNLSLLLLTNRISVQESSLALTEMRRV
jgi:hypothetical protein